MTTSRRHPVVWAVPLAIALIATLLPASSAQAASCDAQNNNTYRKLLDCMTAEGALEHLEALQEIADANDNEFYPGTRAAGTAGYQGSVDYIADLLEDAGWDVTLDPVEATFVFPAILRQLTPVAADYETGVFTGTGDGEVEGDVVPIDLSITDPAASTSGCEATDFGGIDWSGPNDIALIQRGACFFSVKATLAEAAGAEAVVIFNQGTPGREGVALGTAASLPDGSPSDIGIPVVGASFADGIALSQPGSTAYVRVLPNETIIDYNVIAELDGKNDDNVVMAGAHLDSVVAGPGIQDNGSGSAALLELALLLANSNPENTLRFGWWAAEEQGLVGSESYVQNLSQDELDRIAAYVNFDMIASPNYILGVYDADESSFPAPDGVPIPEGSEALEDLFEIYYTWQGIPYEDSQFSGRSDYQEFILNDIPASGLFTGAEVLKTEAQVDIWGGVAGEQYDPCYHEACDNLIEGDPTRTDATYDVNADELVANVNVEALGINADAMAFTVLSLAYSTEDVNGVRGKEVPGSASLGIPDEPAGPAGTVGTLGGGGLSPDHGHDHDEPV